MHRVNKIRRNALVDLILNWFFLSTYPMAKSTPGNVPVQFSVLFFYPTVEEHRLVLPKLLCFLHGSSRGFASQHCCRLTFAKRDVRLLEEPATFWEILFLEKQLRWPYSRKVSHFGRIMSSYMTSWLRIEAKAKISRLCVTRQRAQIHGNQSLIIHMTSEPEKVTQHDHQQCKVLHKLVWFFKRKTRGKIYFILQRTCHRKWNVLHVPFHKANQLECAKPRLIAIAEWRITKLVLVGRVGFPWNEDELYGKSSS